VRRAGLRGDCSGLKSRRKTGSRVKARPRAAAGRASREPSLLGKVLVANRGEIAIRVLRALREMGIPSVAIFSEADRMSSHIMLADEAYCVGPAPAVESYLNIGRIIEVARAVGCRGIHPGYGFLAERPEFAAACEANGLVFIGPGSESTRRMGVKTEARRIMQASGVPVIPGSDGPLEGTAEALACADRIGYPVILKASAGGGGKGMRIVRGSAEMKQAMRTARGEAQAAFGSPEIFAEKYIERPRHIEVQILADNHGNTVYLGERECSIQRRYQKLIEESPSPAVDKPVRAALCRTALKAAKAAEYRNAGTVEFLLDDRSRFYFLEMNTRLQVEHPVTELVTGVDIVREQIRIASGFPLSFSQKDIKPRGHAIECRIYAEDPRNNFLPSLGTIRRLRNPEGPWVRIENYIYEGYHVPMHYDPLVAKVITWGETRPDALARMLRALEEYVVEGIETTIPFHVWVMRDDNFRRGRYDTSYIDEHYTSKAGDAHRKVPVEVALIAAAVDRMHCGATPRPQTAGRANRWKEAARSESVSRAADRGPGRVRGQS
jgi:acetyl-CoA carboxylase biotin carboxylase subunit